MDKKMEKTLNHIEKMLSTKTLIHFGHFFQWAFFVIGILIGVSLSIYYRSIILSLHATISKASIEIPHDLVLPSQPPSLPPSHPSPPPLEKKPGLLHDMEDAELFSRALEMGARSPGGERMAKVAFMFLTKGPMPLSPLWEKFFKGNEELYSIYVHPHPSYVDSYPESSVFFGRRILSKEVQWGRPTVVDAERRLLATALLDATNERFALLSETCIPLFSFNATYTYLTKARTSFVGSSDELKKPGRRPRYNPAMFPQIHETDWRKGSQWFEVNRKVANAIVADTQYYPLFSELCSKPCFMDEHYIPTLVNLVCPEESSNRSVTWVDWSRPLLPHPGRYVRNDVSGELLDRIRYDHNCSYDGNVTTSVCFLFARKFVANTLEPLLGFAPMLLNVTSL